MVTMISYIFVFTLMTSSFASPADIPLLDCEISTNNDLPVNQSLFLIPNSGETGIHAFYLPKYGDLITLEFGQTMLIACPGYNNKVSISGTTEALVSCYIDRKYVKLLSDNTIHHISTLGCSRKPAIHTATFTGKSCGRHNEHSLIKAGFEIGSGGFYTLYETCYDTKRFDNVYTTHTQTPEIKGSQIKYTGSIIFSQGSFYSNVNVTRKYTFETQIETFTDILGSDELARKYLHREGDMYLSEGHLAAREDYVFGAHQEATHYYVNAAPQWQTINTGNWEKLELNVRQYVGTHSYDFTIVTGTTGVATLPDITGESQPLYLNNKENQIKVPKYFWKLVYNPVNKLGMVFLVLNNPYAREIEEEMCKDVCEELKWLTWERTNQTAGLAICCRLDDDLLYQNVPEIPFLSGMNLPM